MLTNTYSINTVYPPVRATSFRRGVSLANLLLANKQIKQHSLCWYYPHCQSEGAVPYSTLRFKDFKLIHNLETDSIVLYNFKNGIDEKLNVARKCIQVTNQLFDSLQD